MPSNSQPLFSLLLACVASLGSSVERSWSSATSLPDPVPDPSAVVLSPSGIARFTVLSPRLVRLQYKGGAAAFSDAATVAVVNRRLPVPAFTVSYPNATAITIATASFILTFDDRAAQAACGAGSWVNGADAGLPRVRLPSYPDGAPVASAAECCALCAGAAGCAGWVWGVQASAPTCWPLASFTGHAPAPGRTFGAASGGFTSANLAISGGAVAWAPGATQSQNLLGTLSYMDCYSSPLLCFAEYTAGLQPGLLARDGWTLFDDSGAALRTPPVQAGGVPWWRAADPAAQDFYFALYGADFKGALANFASVMGAPELPPRAALGVWWSQNYPWTNTTGNASIVTGVLDQYAALDIPLSVLVLDMDWHKRHYPTKNCDTWGSWDFNTSAFPKPAAFIEWLHTSQNPLGHPLAVSLNVHPETGVYSCLEGYAAFTRSVGADPFQNATVPCDMSNSTWAKALFDVFYSAPPLSGVDWFWTDYQGCTNSSDPGQPRPLGWSNLVYAEARAFGGQLRPMTFSRWGGMGSHRYPIGFSGDTFQHELTLDFEVTMTATAANSLFGWWSHDIGGFHADRTDAPPGGACPGDSNPSNATGAELFSRWLQFGALAPILRTHCGGCGPEGPPNCSCDRRIWMFPSHFKFMRDALNLRAALVPYLYTAGRAFFDTAVAPLRALYVEAPGDNRSYAAPHEYFFGGDLLAAPITAASPGGVGAINATVFLPADCAWAPWGGGGVVSGGVTDTRAYGQGEIPLFARAAALLPLALNGGADIANPSPAIAWTLWAAGFAPPAALRGGTMLYEDDGVTQAFKAASMLLTNATFEWEPAGASGSLFELTVRVGAAGGAGYSGQPAARAHAVHVRGWVQRGLGLPSVVAVNGVAVPRGGGTPGWAVVSAPLGEPQLLMPDGMLEIRVGSVGLQQPLVVVVSAAASM